MFKVVLSFGTRPEAIKLAPVYREFLQKAQRFKVVCCVTGQHRELLDSVLEVFELKPDYDLNLLVQNQSLPYVAARILNDLPVILEKEQADMVVVQGDTTSAFAAALCAFYMKIPVAHVEAGLRTYDRFQPYPEEANRGFISKMADLNFCPTKRAAENLIREGVEPASVHVTGNTIVDAVLHTLNVVEQRDSSQKTVRSLGVPQGRLILVTGHRRENFDGGLNELAHALVDLTEKFEDVVVLYSLHPNPRVAQAVQEVLGGNPRIRIVPPPDYFQFIALMKEAYLIITDSGGIQEEAPSLKKPLLIVRNVTERPEAVEAGAAMLVGTSRERIVQEASRLLENASHYESMTLNENPFGDGRSSQRIVESIDMYFQTLGRG